MTKRLSRLVTAFAALSALGAPANAAAEASLFERLHGLHAGIETRVTPIAGQAALLIGPHLGWILGDLLLLELGGYVLREPIVRTEDATRFNVGYGGIRGGFVFFGDSLVHFVPHVLLGLGQASEERVDGTKKSRLVVLAEPMLELEIGLPFVHRFLRGGAAISYRFVTARDRENVDAVDLSGPAAGIFVRISFF